MQGTDTTLTGLCTALRKAIFPDFNDTAMSVNTTFFASVLDRSVFQSSLSVLESTNQDRHRALDVLLGIDDTPFAPSNPPPSEPNWQFQRAPPHDEQRLSQEALDA